MEETVQQEWSLGSFLTTFWELLREDSNGIALAIFAGLAAIMYVVLMVCWPKHNARETPEFWERRYSALKNDDEEKFEWYFCSLELADIIFCETEDRSARILEVGCGLSELNIILHQMGVHGITCIDFAQACIDKRRQDWVRLIATLDEKQSQVKRTMDYKCMNALSMRGFLDGSFDLVYAKATVDCMLGRGGRAGRDRVRGLLSELHRVLRPQGTFVCISCNNEDRMSVLLDDERWQECKMLTMVRKVDAVGHKEPVAANFYVYILKKA